jgi:hypothetical protein
MFFAASATSAQTSERGQSIRSSQTGHEGMDMSMDEHTQMDAAYQRKLLADKKESEFNHHFAGFFVALAGIFLFCEGPLSRRWPFLRFVWPSCFLFSGLFLLVFSDTELWPFGPQSWWYGLTHNHEDLQHKAFAAILLALGILEIQRARGVLRSAWAAWVFPLLACCGSVMLLIHEHHSGMHGPDHMTLMARIQTQHRSFAATGFGIGAFKGLSELSTVWRNRFTRFSSLLMILLGVLLLLYSE